MVRYSFQLVHYPSVLDRFGNLKPNPEKPWAVEVCQTAEVGTFWTRAEALAFTRAHDPGAFAHLLGPERDYVGELGGRLRGALA